MRILDGVYTENRGDDSHAVAQALVAAGGPLFPPKSWYEDPQLDRETPITVTADGRVKGHIATWSTDHMGLPPGTKPPRNNSDYRYFKTGVVQVDDGTDVPVGQLTLAGGHAPMTAGAAEAVKHYDDTASAMADVTVGEDQFGIWVSGGLRPGVTDEQIRALRASAPSGDWRPMLSSSGVPQLELVAICQVNVPGFPVARAMVASGEVTALVAAGARHMWAIQQENLIMAELEQLRGQVTEHATMLASIGAKKKAAGDKAKGDNPFDKLKDFDKDDENEADEGPADDKKDDEGEEKRAKLRERFNRRHGK